MTLLSHPMIRKSLAWIVSSIKWLLLIITCLVLLGLFTEQTLTLIESNEYEPPGQIFQVNGASMHLWCEGPDSLKGNSDNQAQLIVLDAGAALFSTSWRRVMPHLAQQFEVCAFDRAGLGWSDKLPEPYDGISAAKQLNQLLVAANKNQPFIYVGHSLGGMLGRIYAGAYPEQLAGLIMIEPADPDILISDIAESRQRPVLIDDPIKDCEIRCNMASFMANIGLVRLALSQVAAVNDPEYHEKSLQEFKFHTNSSKTLTFSMQRGRYIPQIAFQTKAIEDLNMLPMAIYYSDKFGELLGSYESVEERESDRIEMIEAWRQHLKLTKGNIDLREVNDANHLTIVAYEKPAKQLASYIENFVLSIE